MNCIDKFYKLSEDDIDLLRILALMDKTEQFDEQLYFKSKMKYRKSLLIATIIASIFSFFWFVIYIFDWFLPSKPDSLSSFVLFCLLVLTTWTFCFFCVIFSFEIFNINPSSMKKEFFTLQEVKPDLTVREYFEKKKAKLIAEREQEKKKRFDDIRRKAQDLDLI